MNPYLPVILALCVLSAADASAQAGTDLPAQELPPTEPGLHWTQAGSPYRIASGSVTVPEGYFVTIDAGVRVELGENSSLAGALLVEGTAQAPVTFTRLDPAASWAGLVLPLNITSNIRHARIEGAQTAIESSSPSTAVENCVFSDNATDISVLTGQIGLAQSILEGASSFPGSVTHTGVTTTASSSVSITNTVVTDKSSVGVRVEVTGGSPPSWVRSSTFVGNATGLHVVSDDVTAYAPSVTNTIIANGDVGLAVSGPGGAFVVYVTHSNIWGHQTREYDSAVSAGAGFISADPMFAAPNDFRLLPLSPSIDAGQDPSTTVDLAGTTRPQGGGWDMGAYEAPLFVNRCGDTVVDPGAGEECDDGNVSSADGCTNRCTLAACGDGSLQRGIEDCDDGNRIDGDGCSANCEINDRVERSTPEVDQGGCSTGRRHSEAGLIFVPLLVALALRRRR